MDGYTLITDTAGERHLVDAGGVRYFTEVRPGFWEIAVSDGNWNAWLTIADAIRATAPPKSGRT